jgi:hypothetical protein
MELIIGLVLGLIFFIATIKAYSLGLQHGKQISNGNTPKLELNPVTAIKQHIEAKAEKEQADMVSQGWENIFAYDGTPQKEVE